MTTLSRALLLLANLLLWGYALDACVTVVDTLVGVWWDSPFTAVRNGLAGIVMNLATAWLLVLVILGDRLKRWVLFWLAMSTLWLNMGGQPVGLFFDDRGYDTYSRILGLIQLTIGLATLLQIRRWCGRWILNESTLSDVPWRLRRWAGRMLVKAAAVALLFVSYQPLYLLTVLEQASAGYVHFTWQGMNVRDVEFVDDGDHTVRLVGMAHVGEPAAYQRILESFGLPDTIILEEGVTDRTGLLGRPTRAPTPRHHSRPISVQPPMTAVTGASEIEGIEARTPWVNVLKADVDTAELSPATLEWTREYVRMLRRARSARGLPVELLIEEFSTPVSDGVWEEILYSRNQHLLDALESVEGEFRQIIVPWGALHMPGIARGLEALGYRPSGKETRHLLLRWGTLFRALSGNDEDAATTPPTEPHGAVSGAPASGWRWG